MYLQAHYHTLFQPAPQQFTLLPFASCPSGPHCTIILPISNVLPYHYPAHQQFTIALPSCPSAAPYHITALPTGSPDDFEFYLAFAPALPHLHFYLLSLFRYLYLRIFRYRKNGCTQVQVFPTP